MLPDKDTITYFKKNKNEITYELLESLRNNGSEGKNIALEILDMPKDRENYYLDAFGNRISFSGYRTIKKQHTILSLSNIHLEEIRRCIDDIHYFMNNYIKIRSKSGLDFPDLRTYQEDLLDFVIDEDHENNVIMMPRQSGKSISVSIYIVHCFIFKSDIRIGIVANKGATARKLLKDIRDIFERVPIWLQQCIETWNKSSICSESQVIIMTDVPGPNAFRGETINILVSDEVAFIRQNIWDDFVDSILPSQSSLSFKKNLFISTPNGMNHFYEMVKGARDGSSGMNMFEINWRDVPRFDKDGNVLNPDDFSQSVINRNGLMHFNQNYQCEFVGSSSTLISPSKLLSMKAIEEEERRDGRLKIYEYPIKGNQYIMSVDSAKDGTDAFAVQIIDVTNFEFKQVAAAKILNADYLSMPPFIYEWCQLYNYPYLIIENNEGSGQSIADQMHNDYDYENLHYDRKPAVKSIQGARLRYPGFRTTTKTRKHILTTLKMFIENGKLEIVDSDTIKELNRFIYINDKYQADSGAKDDMVMSLAMIFAPFVDVNNFNDMKVVAKQLHTDVIESEKVGIGEVMLVGYFDDGSSSFFNP